MNILYLATKPPWPPIDGGRLLMHTTLEDLVTRGHRVTFVAPTSERSEVVELTTQALQEICEPVLVPSESASPLGALVRSRLRGLPLSIERHRHPAVLERVESLLATGEFDLIHVEQQQALYAAEPAFEKGLPVVLRAQNVESELWRGTARATPWWNAWHWLGRSEARRLAHWEGKAVTRADLTISLTEEDAAQLRRLSGEEDKVHVVRVPFPAELPPADAPLPGEPAVVVLGSVGWLPNRDGVEWLLDAFWPTVRERLPGACLHLFGEAGDWPRRYRGRGITYHPPPEDSRTAFPPGSTLLVPLRIASGVRMKILEAWARGIPVIATPVAASGLGAEDGRELCVVADGEELAAALAQWAGDPEAIHKRVAAGRQALRERHERGAVVEGLLGVYRRCLHLPSRGRRRNDLQDVDRER